MSSVVKRLLQDGVCILNPESVLVEPSVSVAKGVTLYPNVFLRGETIIGEGVIIHQGCELFDVRIGASSIVRMCCDLNSVVLGDRCNVGPFVELRSVHTGRLCTIRSQSTLNKLQVGDRVSIGSNTFISDAVIGDDVNIAASVVTSNYDGVAKWVTRIGNGVFIGADAQLIAPVEIGDGATIGAGSTITRSAPPGELTLSRARQVTVKGWARPSKKQGSSASQEGPDLAPRETETQNRPRDVLHRLENLLAGDASESAFQQLLTSEYWLCGTEYVDCMPKVRAGADRVPDFALEKFNGLYDIVEIKTPSTKLFVGSKSRLVESRELKAAIAQLYDYIEYFNTHVPSESLFRGRAFRVSGGKLIIGRTRSSQEQQTLQRLNERYLGIAIWSYDDMLAFGQSVLRHVESMKSIRTELK